MSNAILWPTFALVLLIFSIKVKICIEQSLILYRKPEYPDPASEEDCAVKFSHRLSLFIRNIFEISTLYFILVLLILFTNKVNIAQIVMAWLFVTACALNSVFSNSQSVRTVQSGIATIVSNITLAAMWITFFVTVLVEPVSPIR